jgi:hypothetical protein
MANWQPRTKRIHGLTYASCCCPLFMYPYFCMHRTIVNLQLYLTSYTIRRQTDLLLGAFPTILFTRKTRRATTDHRYCLCATAATHASICIRGCPAGHNHKVHPIHPTMQYIFALLTNPDAGSSSPHYKGQSRPPSLPSQLPYICLLAAAVSIGQIIPSSAKAKGI